MKLFTKEINDKLFKQYPKGNDLENQVVVSKIFNPYGKGRWFLINSDPSDPDYLWAIVEMGGIIEIGSVSRKGLESIRVSAWKFPLERDLSFRPQNAYEIWKGLKQGKFYKRGGKTDDCGCETMENGGQLSDENKEMIENQSVEIMHHAKELEDVVKKTDVVEPWVIAKVERSATDLSDVTHYLDGESKKMADGGILDIAKIRAEYDEHEDNNAHSENVVLLAKYFGSESDLRDAKTILAKHEAIGNLPSYLRDERDALSNKLYKKMVIASQGKMAKGGELYVDLFEERDGMPYQVQEVLERYEDEYGEDITYEALLQMQEDMENVGYTFDYGLDAIPYGLRPIGVEITQLRDYDDDEYANGGMIKWQDVNRGDSALVISENKLGLVIKPYGRKFHLSFPDGSEKTYDASELKFIKDEDEYANGGMMAKGGVIASSTSKEGIEKLIGDYYYSKNISIQKIDNKDEYEVSNSKGKINGVKVVVKKGRYQFVNSDKMDFGGMMAKGGKINLGDVVEVKEPNYGYDDSYYVVDNKAGYDKNGFLISATRKRVGDVFEKEQLRKLYGKGGYMEEGGMAENLDLYIDYNRSKPYEYEKVTNMLTLNALQKNGLIEFKYDTGKDTRRYEKEGDKLHRGAFGMPKYIRPRYIKSAIMPRFSYKNKEYFIGYEKGMNYLEFYVLKKGTDWDRYNKDKMAMGGKVKFADKVKSIKSSLLKRKKVSPSVQKDYGKTYSPREAEESAKRIVGAMKSK